MAGWKCGNCRQHGLEAKRRCGFIAPERREAVHVVWARKGLTVEECPTSFISGNSLALVEEFFVRRRLGIPDSLDTTARKIDAFLILRDEMEREERDGKTEY